MPGCPSVCLPGCLSVRPSACLPVHLPVCPLICLSVRLPVCLPVCPSSCLSVGLSVWPSARLSACLSICLSICLIVRPSVCLTVHLSVCPSVRLSTCLSAHLSVCLSARLPCSSHQSEGQWPAQLLWNAGTDVCAATYRQRQINVWCCRRGKRQSQTEAGLVVLGATLGLKDSESLQNSMLGWEGKSGDLRASSQRRSDGLRLVCGSTDLCVRIWRVILDETALDLLTLLFFVFRQSFFTLRKTMETNGWLLFLIYFLRLFSFVFKLQ